MALRTAIFDFDGTIADTFQEVVALLNGLAPEFGFAPAEPAEVEVLRRLQPRQIAQRTGVAWHRLPLLAARVRKGMAARMPSVPLCSGMAEALSEVRAAGISVGLLTSNTRANVDLFLQQHPLQLDFISTGSGLWSKHRRLATVLRRRGLSASECAYIGDETRDVDAGRALGMRVISVAWGYNAVEALRECAPDHLITHPSELLAALRA